MSVIGQSRMAQFDLNISSYNSLHQCQLMERVNTPKATILNQSQFYLEYSYYGIVQCSRKVWNIILESIYFYI